MIPLLALLLLTKEASASAATLTLELSSGWSSSSLAELCPKMPSGAFGEAMQFSSNLATAKHYQEIASNATKVTGNVNATLSDVVKSYEGRFTLPSYLEIAPYLKYSLSLDYIEYANGKVDPYSCSLCSHQPLSLNLSNNGQLLPATCGRDIHFTYHFNYACNDTDRYGWGCQNCTTSNSTASCISACNNVTGAAICCTGYHGPTCAPIPTTSPPAPSTGSSTDLKVNTSTAHHSIASTSATATNSSVKPTNGTITPAGMTYDEKLYLYLAIAGGGLSALLLFILIVSCSYLCAYRGKVRNAKLPVEKTVASLNRPSRNGKKVEVGRPVLANVVYAASAEQPRAVFPDSSEDQDPSDSETGGETGSAYRYNVPSNAVSPVTNTDGRRPAAVSTPTRSATSSSTSSTSSTKRRTPVMPSPYNGRYGEPPSTGMDSSETTGTDYDAPPLHAPPPPPESYSSPMSSNSRLPPYGFPLAKPSPSYANPFNAQPDTYV